jgi:hypothetical protein
MTYQVNAINKGNRISLLVRSGQAYRPINGIYKAGFKLNFIFGHG